MAITQVNLDPPSGAIVFKDTDNEGTKIAVKGSSATIYSIIIDNTANAAEAEYVKLWNVASGSVTVGTTAPDAIIMIPAAVKKTFAFPEGWVFGTALTVATVTTAGTAGTTNPTASVVLVIVYV